MDREKVFKLFLRVVGVFGLLAIPAVVAPHSWLGAAHAWLGLGEFPSEPIVGYLARSTSAFYAVIGGLCMVLSTDIHRYRPVLCYLGVGALGMAAALFFADLCSGMPLWWTLGEGIGTAALGGIILTMACRTRPENP